MTSLTLHKFILFFSQSSLQWSEIQRLVFHLDRCASKGILLNCKRVSEHPLLNTN